MKRRRIDRSGWHAFTLIELMVVLALLTILLAVATFSLRGPYRAAEFEAAVEQVQWFDQQIRDHARRFGQPTELKIELGTGQLQAHASGPDERPRRRLRLRAGVSIDRIVLADRRRRSGAVSIPFFEHGQSPSYAVRLHGDRTSRWLVFAGITGQSFRMNDEKQIQELLRTPWPEWTDAD